MKRRRDDEVDLLRAYLQEIARYPRLTPEEEIELATRAREGDAEAVDRLVRSNLRFVVSYAKKFRGSGVPLLDLIEEGNLGLLHAAQKFDPGRKVKFITYAVWWIRQSILQALSEHRGAFRVPQKQHSLLVKLERAIRAGIEGDEGMPTPQELAAALDVSVDEIQTLLRASQTSFSLNEDLGNDGGLQLEDVLEQTAIAAADEVMQIDDRRQRLLDDLAELHPRERLVLTLRYGVSDNRPLSVEEIGEFIGVDPSVVRNAVDQAVDRLGDSLGVNWTELSHLLLNSNPDPHASWVFWISLADLQGEVEQIGRERAATLEAINHGGTLSAAIDALPLLERVCLLLRYGILGGESFTLRDVGLIMGVSRERVRQIESRAESKCRGLALRR
ncbi:MAG: sigma-70 family RNA polymerase sigma factor [Acidobacteria bacterium]|nr:sigma-70 family RNA polymerase sigma factor [Acidobacteriota bacterium]